MLSRNWSRLLSILALLALAIPLSVAQPAAGDSDDDQYAMPEKTELQYPNLGYHLDQLVASVEAGEASAQEAAEDTAIHQDQSVAVTIHLSGHADDVVQFLEDNGGDPRNVGEDYIEAYVQVTLLGELSEQPGVIRVREIVPPQDGYGPISSQGILAHGAATWHQAGLSGQGIKVGVIDGNFGFRGYRELMGSEVPTPAGVRCYPEVGRHTANLADCAHPDRGSAHGTAVAEAVMDIAPEVELYITSPLSRGDDLDAVDWMVSQGVSVIVQSESFPFDGPGDGTSPFSDSPLKFVDRAVDGEVIWVSSAGNAAQTTWFGPPSIGFLDIVDFSGTDSGNDVVLEAGDTIAVNLRWDDSWGRASRDFDVCVFHRDILGIGDCSVDLQLGAAGHVPSEYLRYQAVTGGVYEVVVFYEGGGVPAWIQLVVRGDVGRIEHYTESGSITNPAESANPGMLAVGAAPWYDVHTIEPFSSRGPTPDDRVKPDIVGVDCAQTASYRAFQRNGHTCWFPGTSQAAPHVAGMAALVRQRSPELTPEGVADYLKSHAERRETVPNNIWGHGFAQLPAHDAVAPSATVALAQDTVRANQTLAISGSGFSGLGAGLSRCIEQGRVLVNNVPVEITDLEDTGPCDGGVELTTSGTFTLTVILRTEYGDIPDALLTAGTYEVSIVDSQGVEGRSQVTIPARELEATPNSTRPGDQITIKGRNFPVNNPDGSDVSVDITYDCGGGVRRTVSAETDASGNFEDTLRVPDDCGVPSTNTITVDTLVDGLWVVTDRVTHDVLPPGPTPSDPCGQTLTGDGSVSGEWAEGCESQASGRGYARYYTFTLAAESAVTVTLESQDADTYLYLRAGEARSGDFLYENDDDGGTTRSTIQGTLEAGTYTVEATTYGTGETGSFTLTVSGLGTTTTTPPGPTPSDPCGQTLTGDGSVSGEWAEGCESQASGRGYARYYTFTLGSESEVTVSLESQDADTYLYLRAGEARSGDYLHQNDDDGGITRSTIRETLGAGTYTIEATTYGTGETGSFTLAVSGLGATAPTPPGPTPSDPCSQTLTGDGSVSGEWAAGCDSQVSERGHARYYSFTLAQESEVTITLESTDADTYLYLRAGEARSGEFLYENDDDGGTTRSSIQETLTAGTYTIEATTYGTGETGSFTLTVSGLGTDGTTPGPEPTDQCGQTLTGDGTVSGEWAEGCDSAVTERGYARYYSFTLGAESEVTITLESTDADTYLYLRAGEARSGDYLYQNDDDGGTTRSSIQETLSAGTYTIEATTYGTGETGSFTLTVSGLGDTTTPGPEPTDECGQTITDDGTVSGEWAAGCDSQVSERGHARYYSFTLESESAVTVTLESTDADTYLYLRAGEARSGEFLYENDDDGGTTRSSIQETLAVGTYTIEATTYGTGATGSFTLTVSGLGTTTTTPPGPTPSDPCGQTLTADISVTGEWAEGCDSEASGRGHARYYSFTLGSESAVTITLESQDADTYLYLRAGEARSGEFLYENDDDGGTTRSTIRETLGAGTYTIEATTYGTGETGSFTLAVSGLGATGTTPPGSPASDREALVALYNATDGPSWANNTGWLSDAPIGEWHGIETDDNGRVVGVDLRENSLSGTIPGDLGNLTSLRWLFLNNEEYSCLEFPCRATSPTANRLTGSIPPELGQLTNLERLYLALNPLTGEIPSELAGLGRLKDLGLWVSQLSGEIPSWLGDLVDVEILNLAVNNFSGPIPVELGNLAHLTHLELSVNQLTGTIPASLGNLSRLDHLGLNSNQLTGSIPASLGNLSNLNSMYITSNELSGCIPSGLRRVPENDFDGTGLPFCAT